MKASVSVRFSVHAVTKRRRVDQRRRLLSFANTRHKVRQIKICTNSENVFVVLVSGWWGVAALSTGAAAASRGVKQPLFGQIRVLVALNGRVSGWRKVAKVAESVTCRTPTLRSKVPLAPRSSNSAGSSPFLVPVGSSAGKLELKVEQSHRTLP